MEQFLLTLFTGGGIAGLILGFYLWKLAPELRAIWRAMDRSTRADLLRIIAAVHIAPELKDEARSILAEVDTAEVEGKKRETIPP